MGGSYDPMYVSQRTVYSRLSRDPLQSSRIAIWFIGAMPGSLSEMHVNSYVVRTKRSLRDICIRFTAVS